MMRSLYAAVSGLRTHQTKMDIVANNISNVNTYGFKSSRVTFQDIFYQTLSAGSEPTDNLGGTNPQQIGLGVTIGSIDVSHTQGATAYTGRGTDLMIQGDGFFVLTDGTGNLYLTRSGNFSFNSEGDLVQPSTGLYVMDVDGDHLTVDPNGKSYSFDTAGNLTYVDSAGAVQEGGQVAIAKFPNPNGLLQVGQNLYQWHQAAGDEVSGGFNGGGAPGEDGRGTIIPGSLEMSNVELAQEITDLIITQRGFQANARVITTSDQMLEELANLKR